MALRCRTRVTAAHEVQIFCLIKWTLVVVKNYLPMDQFPFTLTEFSWSGFQVRIFKSYAFAASSLIIPYPHSLIPCPLSLSGRSLHAFIKMGLLPRCSVFKAPCASILRF